MEMTPGSDHSPSLSLVMKVMVWTPGESSSVLNEALMLMVPSMDELQRQAVIQPS